MDTQNDNISMDEALAKAFNENDNLESADVIDPNTVATGVDDAVNGVADKDTTQESRDRNESGKFKAKDANAQPSEPTQKVSQDAKPDDAKGPSPTFEAPASWRNEAKAQWDKVPLPVKAEIAKRERESLTALNEANNKLASREKEGGDIERVVAPYATDWGARGIRSSEAIAQTLARAKYAYSNPEKFIKEFAAETGVNLDFPQTPDATQDPELAALHKQLNDLKQQVAQAPQQYEQSVAKQQQAQAVHSFADAKDESGQTKRPHFEKVYGLMVNLMPRINATEPSLTYEQKLEKAYDMACRAHPDVWSEMRDSMIVNSQTNQVQQQAAAAAAAKARAVSPASSPLGGSGVDASMRGKSLDDVINHVMTSNSGRV